MSASERESSDAPARIRCLDGIRGLAIALVLMFHATIYVQPQNAVQHVLKTIAGFGWIGVDLFFVLSGFLITGVLLRMPRERFFRTFYLRRTLRIFPVYYLFLALFFLVLPLVVNVQADPAVASLYERQAVFWVYLQNLAFAHAGQFPASSYLDHFWSLAIEEQFYIFWPAIVFVLKPRLLLALCPVLIAVAVGLRIQFVMDGASWVTVYVNTLTRMDTLVVGALLCLLHQFYREQLVAARSWLIGLAVLLSIGVTALMVTAPVTQNTGTQTAGLLAIAMLFGLLIHFTLTSTGGRLTRLFEQQWLVSLGKYSYAIYIVHWPVLYFLFAHSGIGLWAVTRFGTLGVLGTAALGVTVSLGLAVLSWHLFEGPILRFRERLERRAGDSAAKATLPKSAAGADSTIR